MTQPDPLRLAYVVKRYPRYSETFVVNEILAHEQAGVDLEIFSLRPSNDRHFQDAIARVRAPVHYLPDQRVKASVFWDELRQAAGELPGFWDSLSRLAPTDGDQLLQAVHLARSARRLGIVHLHAHFASSAAAVARMAARLAGVTYSFTAHAKDIYHDEVDEVDLHLKLIDAAAVVTVSHYNHAYLSDTFGAAAERVEVVYNGLDLAEFPFRPPAGDLRRIVAVGRLVEKKGFSVLIHACAQLAREKEDFSCEIIGGGELEESLRTEIDRLGLESCVRLLGELPRAEVIRHMQQSAILAAPCIVGADGNRDGMPTVLLEAMALGTPCVATPVSGIPEIVHEGETGLLVAEGDANALAHALRRLLADAALRGRIARLARRRIEEDFDIHRNAARLRELFRVQAVPRPMRRIPPLQEVC